MSHFEHTMASISTFHQHEKKQKTAEAAAASLPDPRGIGFVAQSTRGNWLTTYGDRTEKDDAKAPGAAKCWSDWKKRFWVECPHNVITLPEGRPLNPEDPESYISLDLYVPAGATNGEDPIIVPLEDYCAAALIKCVAEGWFPTCVFTSEEVSALQTELSTKITPQGKKDKRARGMYAIEQVNILRTQSDWSRRICSFVELLSEFTQRINLGDGQRPYRLCEVAVGGIKKGETPEQTFEAEVRQEFKFNRADLNGAIYCGLSQYISPRNNKMSTTATWFKAGFDERAHRTLYDTSKRALLNECNWSCPMGFYKFFGELRDEYRRIKGREMDKLKENRETTTAQWISDQQLGWLDTKSTLIMAHVQKTVGHKVCHRV